MAGSVNPDPEMRAFVEHVRVSGLRQTRDELAHSQLRRLLSDSVSTWGQLMREILAAKRRLQALGVFSQVDVTIDTAKSSSRPELLPYAYDVVFEVRECKQTQYGVSTVAGMDGAVSLVLNGNLRNISGNAERLMFDYQIGTKESTSKFLTLCAPLSSNPFAKFSVGLLTGSVDHSWVTLRDSRSSAFASLALPSRVGDHVLRAEMTWRQTLADSDATPLAVRELCGHSVKCSLRHVFERDTRDSAMVPERGWLLRLSNELSGLGGDVNCLRQFAQASASLPLPLLPGVSLHAVASVGRAAPLAGDTVVPVSDRFLLGGPSSGLRGFDVNSCGPATPRAGEAGGHCYVGGCTLLTAGAHLYSRLPLVRGSLFNLFRLHAFVNAGSLLPDPAASVSDFAASAEDWRLSCGAGCLVALGSMARIELNYTLPLRSGAADSRQPGFGVAVQVDSPL